MFSKNDFINESRSLLSFIDSAPTGFHACKALAGLLKEAGCEEIFETENTALVAGKAYFVSRNGSSLIAFRMPKSVPTGFMIAASHADSPTFKLKEQPELQGPIYVRLNTERYGGMIPYTWLDRPLSVAGRLLVKAENGVIESRLVNVARDLVLIPSVAPHMAKITEMNPTTDTVPLFGSAEQKDTFMKTVAEAAGTTPDAILSHDLFLYPRTAGAVWGADEEYVSSPRLDDLECAYASVRAFCDAIKGDIPDGVMPVCSVFDNEEVGSQSKQGAASTFLYDTLHRAVLASGGNEADYLCAVASSFMISADNAHAVHPNHPEYADPTHRPQLNGGIVIKRNASQRYTTDAVSSAIFSEICRAADVPTQYYFNRSDMPGGSTLGNIANTQVSLNTVDIGMPQLAMHSSYETAGIKDTAYLIAALKKCFQTKLTFTKEGFQITFA